MIRQLALFLARNIPKGVKDFCHSHRGLDRLSRKLFSGLIGRGETAVLVAGGPMQGLKLAHSEHISHAHILGDYERDSQQAIESLIEPGFVCYDLGASIGYLSILMARTARMVYCFEPAPHA
ncbi:MAG TPA: hypothetical protein VH744_03655, partial [Terriglobales bacterium]